MKSQLILILLILELSAGSAALFSQDTIFNKANEKRLALVIGNGKYVNAMELANPVNDARAIKEALKKIGFDVYEYEDLDQAQMKLAIDRFGADLKNYTVGLFFYAGHGIQSKGLNYLIPVNARLESEVQVEYDCVQADRILGQMEAAGSKVNIVILDACRNNPFERSWTRAATGRGLATMNAPVGTVIGYATAPGSTASDGSGKNGLYTSALLESIILPDIPISQMFQNVARIVSMKSEKQQVPWISSSLTSDFYFNPVNGPYPGVREDMPATSLNETPANDRLYRINGEILIVRILKVTPTTIEFYSSGDESIIKQELKTNLQKIVYSNGREEIFPKTNYPAINSPADWQLVEVLENKPNIGLTEVKRIRSSNFWGGTSGTNMGLNNCIRDLKKKAAALGCPIVVIVDKKLGITTSVEGIAYKVITVK